MKAFTEHLKEFSFYEDAKKQLYKGKTIAVSGCAAAQKCQMIYAQGSDYPYKIVMAADDVKAKELYEDYLFFDKNVVLFPAKDYIFFQADIRGREMTRERMICFRKILSGEPMTIITTPDTFMAPVLPLEVLKDHCITVGRDSVVEETAMAQKLVRMGYEKTYQVEQPGQFSVRGGIIDIFDLTEENPYRIELWGDEVESIRSFDVLSQRSIEGLAKVTVYPATDMILTSAQRKKGLDKIEKEAKTVSEKLRGQMKIEEAHRVKTLAAQLREQMEEFGVMANLDSYMRYFCEELSGFFELFDKEELLLIVDEPVRVNEHLEAVGLEFKESMLQRMEKGYALSGQAALLYSPEQVLAAIGGHRLLLLSVLDAKQRAFPVDESYHVDARNINSFQNSFELLLKDLKRYRKNGYRVILLSPSRTRAKRLAEDIYNNELNCFYSEDKDRELMPGEIMVMYGQLSKGFEYLSLRMVVITESDIFGKRAVRKAKKKRYEGQKIHDFTELKVGDFVVHESHGLGIYRGIEKVCVDKVVKDYMKIEYRDGGNLYVLATGFDAVMKYASSESRAPKLNKLGTQEWAKTKTKVKGAVAEIAKDLVQLYATRQQREGFVYGPDTVWQREFEELFPYEETQDQLLAIEATKRDMESRRIMDRLICGDVGFGKTEIAIRAAFKAVQEGKQVVFLVPTTILAKQHYDNFVQRMKDFPVTVEMMSRFRTPAQLRRTTEGLKKGLVDIVIGTHRVLSKDVEFKDLGLLIIDEEQRFGVAHKEKIKQMREDVDVLTLTATPIPRTLHMSLVGIRDMSVLEEAPNDRMPIQTFVMEYNEEMVREAIQRELARDGQVYYVYNRVNSIAEMTARIQALVPDANVAFAHGQMKESQLERIMYDFVEGEIDVLVSTTIIETGLDIPNVNTMIIHDSDNMGLSQLYQLRGRVGRSNRTAYAFLMYKRDKMLKEVAEKRLQAIKEFTELGSGFKIAMKDLEIRGAGNLLGKTQHGHMEAVGYDLYCKMLNEAVKTMKGQKQFIDFTTTIDMDVDAFIPESYIVNEYQKLDIYKRIAAIESREESEEMRSELMDRFGEIPRSVENLLRISLIRMYAHDLYVTEVKGKKDGITFIMDPKAKIRVENIEIVLANMEGKLKFSVKGIPTFFYRLKPTGVVQRDEEQMLSAAEKVVMEMRARLL
ncbi:MAG: transcription-repair coupling factor [Lachnospiraceae bacterium]|nr:transcription-repair coupling factor [Lachnospiraceae bacterium]